MKRSRKSGIPYWAYWGRKGNQPVRRADAPRKVHFEPLEQRVLLSGDLNYAAAPGAALDVMLRLNEGKLEVLDNATRAVLANQALAETDRVVSTGSELGDAVAADYATPFDTPVFFDGGDQSGSAGDLLRILSEAGKTVKIGAGDGGSIAVSNVEEIFGGTGADTLVGPDAAATWTVTGAGSGTAAGVSFSSIENLSGGAGADSFVFAGGSVSSVSGGAGSDTLDLSAGTAGVTVDLSSGTAT